MEVETPLKHMPSNAMLSGSLISDSQHGLVQEKARRPPLNGSRENSISAPLPSNLNILLKTLAEPGELDLFTKKSPQLPRLPVSSKRFNSPRNGDIEYLDELPPRAQHDSRYPGRSSGIDDRKCLPSYARDATSEIVSMYETASQKASYPLRYEDSDSRTCSMNQTFQSSSVLWNHRSFASLRSQLDLSMPQRPRSPFPYPARLKRPGFRPSSPVLTDSGGVDYARRAEIDRPQTSSMYNTSSPYSLYAHKKIPPPLSVGSDANKSNSSLPCPSPPRRQRIRNHMLTNDSLQDWRSRSEMGPMSPASTCSFTSTTNLFQLVSSHSTSTTPAKATSSSPLYYDYTEDFEVNLPNRKADSVECLPPPPFLVDTTIPENKELSAEWSSLDPPRALSPRFAPIAPSHVHIADWKPPFSRAVLEVQASESTSDGVMQDLLSLYTIRQTAGGSSNNYKDQTEPFLNRASIRRFDKDEMLNLETMSNYASTYIPSSHMLPFPIPFDGITMIKSDPATTGQSQRQLILESDARKPEIREGTFPQMVNNGLETDREFSRYDAQPRPGPRINRQDVLHIIPAQTSSAQVTSIRSSPFFSVKHGLQDLAQLITEFESGNQTDPRDYTPQTRDVLIRPIPALPSSVSIMKKPLSKICSESDLGRTNGQLRRHIFPVRQDNPSLIRREGANSERRWGSFENQDSSNAVTISDPNILKVKNGVSQLMKALPPLPREGTAIASVQQTPNTSPRSSRMANDSVGDAVPNRRKLGGAVCTPTSVDSKSIENSAPRPQRKFKLKSKSSAATICPPYPTNVRPSNSVKKYSWTSKRLHLMASTSGETEHGGDHLYASESKAAASLDDSHGTISVNRHTKGQLSVGNFETANLKDLFSSPNNLEDIFQRGDEYIEKSRTSEIRNIATVSYQLAPICAITELDGQDAPVSRGVENDQEMYRQTSQFSALDVRSCFSDDSSQLGFRGRNSLRNRISNLRSRMPVPYNTRSASQSDDDALWRKRTVEGSLPRLPQTRPSRLNLKTITDGKRKMLVPEMRHQLKSKISEWFREAKWALVKYIHTKNYRRYQVESRS